MLYYTLMMLISALFCVLYFAQWNKRFDVAQTIFIVLSTVVNIGYWGLSHSTTVEEAIMASRFTYLGGCFLQITLGLFILHMCRVTIIKWILTFILSLDFFIYGCVIWSDYTHLFFESVQLNSLHGVAYLEAQYGPVHTLFYVTMLLTILSILCILVRALRNHDISIKNSSLLMAMVIMDAIAFLIGSSISSALDIMPLAYAINQLIILILGHRISLYETEQTVADTLAASRTVGYFILDLHRRFLGASDAIYDFFPSFYEERIDYKLSSNSEITTLVNKWIDQIEATGQDQHHTMEIGEHFLSITASRMYVGKRMSGYKFFALDESLKRLHERELQQMNTQLQIEKERADTASLAKTQFLANMSHELRTPINTMLGMDTMILRESKESAILEYAMNIQDAGKSLLSIVGDILDFSKIESGMVELQPKEYQLLTLINDLLTVLQPRLDEKGLSFSLQVDERIPNRLIGDDLLLRRVLMNLLSNAIKYTPSGTVTLRIALKNKFYNDVNLLFEVIDTGIGIKSEDIDFLFQQFVRIEENRNRSIAGTGLGINIVTGFLELMGSRLSVTSIYGKGSTFSFPLSQNAAGDAPIGNINERLKELTKDYHYQAAYRIPDAKLLVVDDNSTNRLVFRGLLKAVDCTIDEAQSGTESIQMARERTYDLIFMDHMMPEMDGIEAFHHIREDKEKGRNTTTPIIVLTANAVAGAKETYLAEGFTDFLTKPIDAERLEQLIYDLLPPSKLLPMEEVPSDAIPSQDMDTQLPLKEKYLSVEFIDWDVAKTNLPDRELMQVGFTDFVNNSSSQQSKLTSFYSNLVKAMDSDTGDVSKAFTDYRIQVHSMKSSAAIIGATTLSEQAKNLEYAARDEESELIFAETEDFLERWERLTAQLRETLPSANKEKLPVDYFLVEDYLSMLEDAINDSDIDAMDQLVEQLKDFAYPEEEEQIIQDIAQSIFDIDYDKCMELIAEYKKILTKDY